MAQRANWNGIDLGLYDRVVRQMSAGAVLQRNLANTIGRGFDLTLQLDGLERLGETIGAIRLEPPLTLTAWSPELFDQLTLATSRCLASARIEMSMASMRFALTQLVDRQLFDPPHAFSLQTEALMALQRASSIDWHIGDRLGAVDLVAPASNEEAALVAFPPDLVEDDPLGSDLVIDAYVARSQSQAELFLLLRCEVAARRMASARRRLDEGDEEALAQALMSCRRALTALADELYPPQQRARVRGPDGEAWRIDGSAYVNRLILFLANEVEDKRMRGLAITSARDVRQRLDALTGQLSKGVHADVVRTEAEGAYVATWAFIAHVARFVRG